MFQSSQADTACELTILGMPVPSIRWLASQKIVEGEIPDCAGAKCDKKMH